MIRLQQALFSTGLLILLFTASGCLVEEHDLQINTDGSAKLKIHYGMPDRTIAILKSAEETISTLPEAASDTPNPPFKNPYEFNEETIKALFSDELTPGVTLNKIRTDKRNGWTFATLTLDLKDLTSFESLAGHTTLLNHRYSLKKDQEDRFHLVHQTSHHQSKASVDMTDPHTKRNLTPMLAGLNVSVNMKFPGIVSAHNAHSPSPGGVSWTYSFDKHPKTIEKLQTDTRTVVFTTDAPLQEFELKHPELQSAATPTPPAP